MPWWAPGNKLDQNCDYALPQMPHTWGSCDLPNDIDGNGKGSDQTWINWVTAIANHVNPPCPGCAHIKYWEIWNEVYRSHILSNYIPPNGTPVVIRLRYLRSTGANDPGCPQRDHGQGLINGLPCTAIDPTAQIVMPSSVANTNGALAVAQNFLYCNDNPKSESKCTTGNQGANAVDIINYHLYVNQEPVETNLMNYVNGGEGLNGIRPSLQPAELAKPLWSGEDSWGVTNNNIGQFMDPDLQAAFVARYHMIAWSLDIASEFWYAYDNQAEGTLLSVPPPPQPPSLTEAGIAYQQVYNWMVGRSMTSPCALTTKTIWNCTLTAPGGYQGLVVWDTSQTCNPTCGTNSYSVGVQFRQYRDLSGNVTQITGNSVPVGIKPILVENQQSGMHPESRRRSP